MADNKDKEGNFKRLAESRTNKVIDMLMLIGNLSNKSNYSYTQDQVDKMFNTIEEELQRQKAKFSEKKKNNKTKFRL
ncbi:hypothetical protein [Dubosiella newyorkensis]|uniref:hypothetical protein n=2 Tax=Dubosiella newyorkensis TaxID=1862672 RepID=UPI0023F5546E|nr:hypothetical protein [Dubosiella newyorkensis]